MLLLNRELKGNLSHTIDDKHFWKNSNTSAYIHHVTGIKHPMMLHSTSQVNEGLIILK